ncbi:hypothetical protein BSKO_05565 [Bryopsis sp. KO-2023]|nr:hypothetical protein BSKO_05565 [Bryopsis sp. KO-2023]
MSRRPISSWAGRKAKKSKEAAEELDSKAEALSEQLANISIACARDRSDSLIDQFKREIRAKAEMIDELMDDSSAISESFASECMEGPKNGLPNMERIVNLWKSACDARQLRVSELEKSVSDLKANKKKEIKEVQLELESKQEILLVKSENDKVMMEANDLRVELVVARRAIDSKDAELSDGLDRLARLFSFRREVEQRSGALEKLEKESKCAKKELDEVQSQAKATKEQMQEFEDALQPRGRVSVCLSGPSKVNADVEINNEVHCRQDVKIDVE